MSERREEYEIIIVGGGPAGLAAAVYAGRADRKVLLLERGLIGGQVALTMDIANYPGFAEGIDGPKLAERMRAQAERYGVEFHQAEARSISRDNGMFTLELAEETLRSPVVIVATGSTPRKLGVPGEEELRGRGVSYCGTCDAPFFRNKRVLVVGGGDTALKEALHLAKFASEITIVHRRDEFRAEKIYQKQVLSTEKIRVLWDSKLVGIMGEKSVQSARVHSLKTGTEENIETEGVFIFVGTTPNTSLICKLIPANCQGHIDTDIDMMTAIPGLFAVGDVREHSYRQIATAVGEGATAAMAAEHYLQEKED